MARSCSLCLRLFASGVVLATAFSLNAPLSSQRAATAGKALTFARPEHPGAVPVAAKTDFQFRLKSVAGGSAAAPKEEGFLSKIWTPNVQIASYILVWYLGNIYYNIYNKKALNLLPGGEGHWALAASQLLVGVLFVLPMWILGIRPRPNLTLDNWKALAPIGVFNAAAHGASVLALGAGAVSFGQIVKAGEPVHAALTGALILKEIDHPLVYLSLVPIIAGVSLASLKELSFTWKALICASAANQAAAFKNVVSKKTMGQPWAKALGPQNTYAVVTLLGFFATLPAVLIADVPIASKILNRLTPAQFKDLAKYAVLSGLNFYVYNEFSFLALNRLTPVTHSVANTLKRVVIIVASCIVFQTPMTLLGGIGSGIAILGTLLYSLAKKQYGGGKH